METSHYELIWQISKDGNWRATCACGWYDRATFVSKNRAYNAYTHHINGVYLKGE